MAGLEPAVILECPNRYWPDVPDYADLRRENPWWHVVLQHGTVLIGRRKRVWSVSWEQHPLVGRVHHDPNVTCWDKGFHAYTWVNLLSGLTTMAEMMRSCASSLPKERSDAPVA